MANENNRYLVKVHEYGGRKPCSFRLCAGDIRRILINKQKLDVLKKQLRMYEDAMQRNNAEIY